MKNETEPVTSDVVSEGALQPSMKTMTRCLLYIALSLLTIGSTFAFVGFAVGWAMLCLWLLGITTGRLMPAKEVLEEYLASAMLRRRR